MDEMNQETTEESKAMLGAPRVVRPTDPDVFSDPDSARVRARQIGCIGIRRYNNRNGGVSWMPCTNESDYRRVSGFGHSGRRFRRQQLEREVRQIVGGRGGRKVLEKSANYTKPELRERIKQRIMAGSKGGRPGQWSARKAQLLALAYRKAGGGYKGGKSKKQRSLTRWTKQKWRTSDGKPAIRGNVTRRYLPAAAWRKLTPAQRAATNRKKIQGSKRGQQFVSNTEAARRARARSAQGKKHLEFYEDFEFKAIGKNIGRSLPGKLGRGESGKRRFSRRIGGAMEAFDPNPVDADLDNLVQEGTIWERPAAPSVPEIPKPAARQPQVPETQTFGRAARMADGRFRQTAPDVAQRVVPSTQREVRRGAAQEIQQRITRARQTARRAAELSRFDSVPVTKPRAARAFAVPETYRDDTSELIRSQRANIYRLFTSGEYSVQSLADQFDVVRDEIQQAIRAHEKARNSNMRRFKNRNPKLAEAIERFANSRDLFIEGIKERKFSDWDSMVQYVFRSPDLRANRKYIDMQNDLYRAFASGKNPDRESNLSLGYAPSAKGPNRPPVKTFEDRRNPRPEFRPASSAARAPESTGTYSDVGERAARRYRRDALRVEAIQRGRSISGAMSVPTNPAEEAQWKRREWKRQQLKNFVIDSDLATKYPTLASLVGNNPLTDAINSLDGLTDADVDKLWDDTVNEIAATPGEKIPAYQARNAPLSPRELSAAATVRRPLVKAFLDEYNKYSPSGPLSKVDPDALDDKNIESFYNTFILPELLNNGAPTIQEVERAASTPESIARLTDAEQLLLSMPSDMMTLEMRMKIARKALVDSGVSADDPNFDAALEKMIQDHLDLEATQLAEDVEKWLAGGFDKPKSIPINPLTNNPYTQDELDEQLALVMENIQNLQSSIDQESLEQLGYIGQIRNVLAEALGLEQFLESGTKTTDNPPLNPLTGKSYTLREWIESGSYKLNKVPTNPLTGRKYTAREMQKQIAALDEQMAEIRRTIGLTTLSELNTQNELFSSLVAAAQRAGWNEGDQPDSPDMPDTQAPDEEEGPSIEELDQQIQDALDAAAGILDKETEDLTINREDIVRAKQLRRRLDSLIGTSLTLEDTDEVWNSLLNPLTGQPYPAYDGSIDHPLNRAPDGTPLNLNDPDFMLPQSIYNEHLNPNNPELQEWLDIDNTHTVGRYTAPPRELLGRFYQGDVNSPDPDQIDKRISWDRLIGYIQKTAPSLFKKNRKNELVGDINELTRNGQYGGASMANVEFDPSVPSSGYQFEQQLSELRDAALASEREKYLSADPTSVNERTKLWNLFDASALTADEIAFDEQIIDADVVATALLMHATDNNIPTKQFSAMKLAAQQAEPNRRPAYDKKRTKRLIDEVRELARLAGSASRTGNEMIAEIDRAIQIQEQRVQKIGLEYDQFRREDMALQKMITSMLQTRPKNRPIVRDAAGNIVQDGWDSSKEPLARYLNRIQRWDDEFIGTTNPATGERRIGIVSYLINHKKARARATGEAGGASATTFIMRVAQNNIQELQNFKQEISDIQRGARSSGISGFMNAGGPLNRAEFAARRGARKAAFGRYEFANPQILKRYDRSGFGVARQMVGQSSGFNRMFADEISHATRNNSYALANKPGFEHLDWREQSIIRSLDSFSVGGKMVSPNRAQARKVIGRPASSRNKQRANDRDVIGYHRNVPKLYNRRISGEMAASRQDRITALGGRDYLGPNGILGTGVEQMENGRYYVVNRHGEIIDPTSYASFRGAQESAHEINRRMDKLRRPLENPQNVTQWQAAQAFIRQSGYRSAAVNMQNVLDVSPVMPNGEKNRYIFKTDAAPKPRAGDVLITRKNPDTGKIEALVIERAFGPHRIDAEGTVSLPGGMFDSEQGDKDLFDAALREALEETGLAQSDLLSVEKLGIIDAPDWDPRFSKGIEVGAVLVEVPPTWQPVAGDDARAARFVALEELANGNVPLGFGHTAWFEAAYAAHPDDYLSELGSKFAIINSLARQRQQTIIKEVNEQRKAWNEGRIEQGLTLFDQEHPQLGLFPERLPDTQIGWQTTGPEALARKNERVGRIVAQLREFREANKPNNRQVRKISGAMMASAVEMGPDDFAASDDVVRQRLVDDVVSMRRTGMNSQQISTSLAAIYSLPEGLQFGDGTAAPTDELIQRIVSEAKSNGLISSPVKDQYTKRRASDLGDVATLARSGFTVQEISDALDISETRASGYMKSLGFKPREGNTIVGGREKISEKLSRSPIERAMYIDSTYGRLPISEISSKYGMPESEVRESIDSFRTYAEGLGTEVHEAYREALNTVDQTLLSRDEMDVVKMRLDGLSLNEIAEMRNMGQNATRTAEQTGMAKLRAAAPARFLGLGGTQSNIDSTNTPWFEYMTNMPNRAARTGVSAELIRAMEMREFRNNAKDMYMMNQYMGTPVESLASRFSMPEKAVRAEIDKYISAIDTTDNYRNRAIRRSLSGMSSEVLSDADIDFINMRNDGASYEDMARYFTSDALSMRAYQMGLMHKVNQSSGITGTMRGLGDIDSRDLYSELGVPDDATAGEIDNAFRFIARQNISGSMRNQKDSIEALRKASEAFAVLSSPEMREQYDRGTLKNSEIVGQLSRSSNPVGYMRPGTRRIRPSWVGDALNGRQIRSSNMFKLPHMLGSDEISDDIDDGLLGFGLNDADIELVNSSLRPISGISTRDASSRTTESRSISGKMANLPAWDDSYEKSLNVGLPKAEPLPDSLKAARSGQSTFSMYGLASKTEAAYVMKSTFGGQTEVKERRFWGLYFPVAEALSKAVTKKRKRGERKVFVSIGGAPGSGKTSMRTGGFSGIPDQSSAVHVDADKIKLLIPEAKALHALGNPNWGDMAHEESRLIADLSLRVAMEQDHDIVYDSTGQFNSGFDTLKAARAKGYDIVMHYVSAPESVLDGRVKERAKTDPRKLPGHIIPATINRNYTIMPSVADAADEFYLWDSSGKSKVLVAKKEKGKKLEILDPRAYLYGGFDDNNQSITLESPITPTPQRKVSKGSLAGRVITDRNAGLTYAEIAKKHNTTKENAFVLFNEAEIDPSMPEPVLPKTDKNGQLDFGSKPKKKSSGYVSDSDARDIFLSLPQQVQDDMWKMVAGELDDVVKKELNEYLQRNNIPVDVTVWAWENQDAKDFVEDIEDSETARIWEAMSPGVKDAIAEALESGSDPLDISMILGTPLSVIDYAAGLMYMEEDDGGISGEMSSGRIGRRVKKINAKNLEQASLEKSPRWSAEEIARAAQKNINLGKPKKPGISGNMSFPGMENLDDELKPYFEVDNQMGFPMVRHPYLYWLFATDAEQVNKAFTAKKNAVEKALANKQWNSYVYLHERPYRVQAFMDIEDQLGDKEYWEMLSDIWIDSENNWQEAENWEELLSSSRPGKEFMMNDDERKEFNNLPQKLTIYRGSAGGLNENGPSWTTSKERAQWFAERAARTKQKPKVLTRTIDKSDVVAYFTRRGESEILIPPSLVE